MIETTYQIIAVDNEEKELNSIVNAFNQLRVACLPVLYNSGDEIAQKYSNVRIAFFDINLGLGNPNDTMLCNIIASALKEIMDVDNGPYALIFWSLHVSKVDIIKNYIENREKENIPNPLILDTIDKSLVVDPKKFTEELKRVLSNSTLDALLDYEQKARFAAANTINSICSLIPRDSDKWGESKDFETNFNLVFSKMSTEALGSIHAQKNPTLAIQNALYPLLQHNLLKKPLDNIWEKKLTNLQQGKINLPQNFNHGVLNAIYHIDKETNIDKGDRGAVLKIKLNSKKFKVLFDEKRNDFCKKHFEFKNKSRDAEKIKLDTDNFLSNCEPILVEISASCDYSQQNPRIFKYLFGIKCSLDEFTSVKKCDYLYVSPVFSLNEANFIIVFNLRYVFGYKTSHSILGDVIFRFGENFVNLIGNKYANYVSRIGIISHQ